MPNSWTSERRAAQAERIRTLKPWLKSTGPKTKAGKKRASQNAFKHGERRAHTLKTEQAIRLSRAFRKIALEILVLDIASSNELYKTWRQNNNLAEK